RWVDGVDGRMGRFGVVAVGPVLDGPFGDLAFDDPRIGAGPSGWQEASAQSGDHGGPSGLGWLVRGEKRPAGRESDGWFAGRW
ncbi:hypothetical protein HMPREF9153_2373, partial [Cutibacterium avidum ATCC 25577]